MKSQCRMLASVMAVASVLAAGCASGAPGPTAAGGGDAAADMVRIGFITKFPVDFYDTMVDAARAWDEAEPGAEVVFAQGASGTDDEGVIAAIESMVTQGVAAIAITPTSPNVQDALQGAVDAGIAVVLVDNDIPDWDGKSSVVATDNLAGGRLAGEWLAENLPPGATIGVLQGVLGNPSLDARVDGMLETLGDAAAVVGQTATDCDQTTGLDAAQDLLTANPGLTAIYAACGPPMVGALEAISAVGRGGQLVTVGFDASPDELSAIVAGSQSASVAQFPAEMGTMGAQTAFDAASGRDVPELIDTGTEIVTVENAADFQ